MSQGAQKNSNHPANKHWIVKCSMCERIIAECKCEAENKVLTTVKCILCKLKNPAPKMIAA